MKYLLTSLVVICLLIGFKNANETSSQKIASNMGTKVNASSCTSECMATKKSTELTCKLTSPELQERRETVLLSLKKQIVTKKELENGYALKFPGSDNMLDELTEFIKTERTCCDFFVYGLSISGDQSEIWLHLTGPEGAKDFITLELGI